MSMMRNVAGLVAALCVAAVPAAAQPHGHGNHGGQAQAGGMTGMHLPGPAALLDRAGELSLSPEQVHPALRVGS